MRRLLVAVALLACVACGKDSPTAPSQSASVQFRLDQNSCGPIFGSSTLTFTFFIDGSSVGSFVMGVNQTSPAYPVTAGSHVVSASVPNTTARWNNINITVAAGSIFTAVMTC